MDVLVTPERTDGPLLAVMSKSSSGLIYVTNASVPERVVSDFVNVYDTQVLCV